MLGFIPIYNLYLWKVLKLYIENIYCIFSQCSDIKILYYARRNYGITLFERSYFCLHTPYPDIRFVPNNTDQLECHLISAVVSNRYADMGNVLNHIHLDYKSQKSNETSPWNSFKNSAFSKKKSIYMSREFVFNLSNLIINNNITYFITPFQQTLLLALYTVRLNTNKNESVRIKKVLKARKKSLDMFVKKSFI